MLDAADHDIESQLRFLHSRWKASAHSPSLQQTYFTRALKACAPLIARTIGKYRVAWGRDVCLSHAHTAVWAVFTRFDPSKASTNGFVGFISMAVSRALTTAYSESRRFKHMIHDTAVGSLRLGVDEGDEYTLAEAVADPADPYAELLDADHYVEIAQELGKRLTSPRQREIFLWRAMHPDATQADTAEHFGISLKQADIVRDWLERGTRKGNTHQ